MGIDMPTEKVWENKDMKILKWAGGYVLYDTEAERHVTSRTVSDDGEENMRRIELLKEYARGYKKAKLIYG